MIQLPNGCYCSELSIFPKDWDRPGASIKVKWYINYRFYDPTRKDAKGKPVPHQRIIKGMNTYKSLGERRTACRLLYENELKMLKEFAYNGATTFEWTKKLRDLSPNFQSWKNRNVPTATSSS